ncbi:MAG: hypothetical protein A2297_05025 [Elusimicrobia bacterium RIFOXYB2_FULL_48_7]|nr:MAG: hypothetical protein A2297_05025 [Elusimicrobia bacterium RIFOXYB2_FULL_48_7]
MNKNLILILGLVVVSAGVYMNTLKNEFMWDDEQLIQEDRCLKSFEYIGYIFTPKYWKTDFSGYEKRYRPLRALTFMAERALWGETVAGYHVTNIVLNSLVVFILYILLKKITGNLWGSFFGALIFAVHPVHTEAVTWIKNRTDILCCLFMLLSFWLFLNKEEKTGKNAVFYWLFSLISFVLALLSKEMALMFPALLSLYLLTIGRTGIQAVMKKTAHLWAISLAYFIFLYFVLKRNTPANVSGFDFLYMLGVAGQYIRLLFSPFNLQTERTFVYPVDYIFLGLFITALIFVFIKKEMKALFSFGWILTSMLPVVYVEPLISRPIAEQRLYIPSIGIALLLAGYLTLSDSFSWKLTNALAIGVVSGIAVVFSWLTLVRNTNWETPVKFWALTVSQSPGFRSYNNLGVAYEKAGAIDYAIKEYNSALEVYPGSTDVRYNLGVAYYKKGDSKTALEVFESILKEEPENAFALKSVAKIYEDKGDYITALEKYSEAAKLSPYDFISLNSIGVICTRLGKFSEAEKNFLEALKNNPGSDLIYYNLGLLYHMSKRLEEAAVMYEKTLRYNKENTDAMNNLGILYDMLGEKEKAVTWFKKAIDRDPGYFQAHYNLGNSYFEKEMYPEALGEFSRVLELNPGHKPAKEKIEKIKKISRADSLPAASIYSLNSVSWSRI